MFFVRTFIIFTCFSFSVGAHAQEKETTAPASAKNSTETKISSTKKQKGKKMETSTQTSTAAHARVKTIHGDIVFTFFPEVAPKTSARIQELIKQEFYNGLTFHRVVPGFVIQGGDPTGTGGGGSGQKLPAEFSKALKHERGSLAMARTNDPNSADSQFYIALAPFPHLDGQYTIFGKVTQGLEILDKVKQGDKMVAVSLEP